MPDGTVEWAKQANRILIEHGAVSGNRIYAARHQARWRAQRLIQLLIELRLHERWELAEHTDSRSDGWIWTVEFKGRNGNGRT